MVYILLSALFLLVATISYTKLLNNPRKNLNLPPVVKAWPLVGVIYMFVKDPISLIQKNYQKHGSVFTMKVLGYSITMLIGPEVSRHFHMAPESELSQGELIKFTIPMFGTSVFYGVSAEKRRQQIQFIKTGMKPQMLRQYVRRTFAEAQVCSSTLLLVVIYYSLLFVAETGADLPFLFMFLRVEKWSSLQCCTIIIP